MGNDNEMTQAEYYTQCREIAQDVWAEAGGDRDEAFEALHEAVDGHAWIIYTFRNLQVLTHSRNCDAWFEEYGPLEVSNFSDAVQKMAFAAMYADCSEYLNEII